MGQYLVYYGCGPILSILWIWVNMEQFIYGTDLFILIIQMKVVFIILVFLLFEGYLQKSIRVEVLKNKGQSKKNKKNKGDSNDDNDDNDSNDDIEVQFQNFVKKNKKNYKDRNQFSKRKNYFAKTIHHLKQAKNNCQAQGYYLELNKFSDWSDSQKKEYLTYRTHVQSPTINHDPSQVTPSQRKRLLSQDKSSLGLPYIQLPSFLDYRVQGHVSDVKDQGDCGACWAFAGVAQIQSLLSIHDGKKNLDLSEQYGIQCGDGGCWGGAHYSVISKMYSGQGIPLQTSYPYKQNNTSLYFLQQKICSKNSNYKIESKRVIGFNIYSQPSDELLKRILVRQGPLSVAIDASYMYQYRSGVFKGCKNKQLQINHVVLLVGYTEQGDWIIKNSWGEDWGQSGFAIIAKQANCGMTDAAEIELKDVYNLQKKQNKFKVKLMDSFGDGWNGNIIQIYQQGQAMQYLGYQFDNGKQMMKEINLADGVLAEVSLKQLGNFSYQCEFQVISAKNQIIYQHKGGKNLKPNGLMGGFIPGMQKVRYFVTLTSNDTDMGLRYFSFGFKQLGVTIDQIGTVTNETNLSSEISLYKGYETAIFVESINYFNRKHQVGIQVVDQDGNTVYRLDIEESVLWWNDVLKVFQA